MRQSKKPSSTAIVRRFTSMALMLVALAPVPVQAHGSNLSFLDLALDDDGIRATLQIPVEEARSLLQLTARQDEKPAEAHARLAAWFVHSVRLTTDEGMCTGTAGEVSISADPVSSLTATYTCPGSLAAFDVYSRLLDALGRDHVTFVRVESGELTHQAMLTAGDSHTRFEIGSTSWVDAAGTFLVLGMEHIFLGFDHVLFLLTLLLIGGTLKRIVLVATSFTVAHSITLSLAALEIVNLPGAFVESVIALSIGWVALENFRFARRSVDGIEPLALRLRWVLTFAFGLIHGFGFAGVLGELGLPRQHLAVALGAFNIGVELGQVVILVAAYPLLQKLDGLSWYRPRGVQVASLGVLALAVYWFLERAIGW